MLHRVFYRVRDHGVHVAVPKKVHTKNDSRTATTQSSVQCLILVGEHPQAYGEIGLHTFTVKPMAMQLTAGTITSFSAFWFSVNVDC